MFHSTIMILTTMKRHRTLSAALGILFFAAGVFTAAAQPSKVVTTTPVYVPDYTHANDPMPAGVIAWDDLTKTTDATNGQDFARFVFTFTNLATKISVGLATNVISLTNLTTVTNSSFWARLRGRQITQVAGISTQTNAVTVTNSIPVPLTILSVHPGCGCTTAELPPVPWTIPAGSNGVIKVSVNLAGKSGSLFKTVAVSTDKGKNDLALRINILAAPPMAEMTEAQRAQGLAAAKVDRQAIFKGDCASCHLPPTAGKYSQNLYDSLCAICHNAAHRATMVPDLKNLPIPTSVEFWSTWITAGKPGTLMPAFATSQGGPLNDMQIASLAAYLNSAYPSHPTAAPATK
jgi:mono/diheme cytochrome c family protein